jgi:hypothetical protein
MTISGHGTHGERVVSERYSVEVRGWPVVGSRGVNGEVSSEGDVWRVDGSSEGESLMEELLDVRRLRLRGDVDSLEKDWVERDK